MTEPHNLLVSIHSEESKILSNVKYNIGYTLQDIKRESMRITGDKEKDSKNNFYLVKTLEAIEKLNEIVETLERHDNWYKEYIDAWKKEKEENASK